MPRLSKAFWPNQEPLSLFGNVLFLSLAKWSYFFLFWPVFFVFLTQELFSGFDFSIRVNVKTTWEFCQVRDVNKTFYCFHYKKKNI